MSEPMFQLSNSNSPLQVTEETEEMRFNTALAAMMEFVNGGAHLCSVLAFCRCCLGA